jgi:DNA-binding NarL/FixJ family response regulator
MNNQITEKIKIIIADDHPLMRKGLKDLFEEHSGNWEVVGEASDGEEALLLIEKFAGSILIIDIDMPRLNGLEVAKILQTKNISSKVIILTMYDKENMFNRAMDLGVMGYILKDSAANEIIDAVNNVAVGKFYISPSLSGFLVKRGQFYSAGKGDAAGISSLTGTERKILKMISNNMTTKEIANDLFISTRTVETHRSNICQKLDLHGTNALLRFALEQKDLL